MSEWPQEPPAEGTIVTIEKPGGTYSIRAVGGYYLVDWPANLQSEIRHEGDGFTLLITDGNTRNPEYGDVLAWAEVGERHP